MSDYEDETVPVQDVAEELIKFANEAEEHVSSLKNQTEHQSPSQGSDDNGFVVLPTQQSAAPVVATAPQKPTSVETKTTEEEKPAKKVSNESSSSSGFKACPYYFLGKFLILFIIISLVEVLFYKISFVFFKYFILWVKIVVILLLTNI
jgi:hypothetical protein